MDDWHEHDVGRLEGPSYPSDLPYTEQKSSVKDDGLLCQPRISSDRGCEESCLGMRRGTESVVISAEGVSLHLDLGGHRDRRTALRKRRCWHLISFFPIFKVGDAGAT